MAKIKLTSHLKRRIIQGGSALLLNPVVGNYFSGNIYRGQLKGLCVPVLNCYSCPAAIGSCPLGTLQNALGGTFGKLLFYVIGALLLFGLLLGRIICGFLCPFGLIQELLFKVPVPKLKKSRVTRTLSYGKYVVLLVFVIVIPLALHYPAFCKFICPAGTLEGGIPLTIANETLRSLVGFLFGWKTFVLVAIIVAAMFISRVFCRFLCPLGAVYSLFSRVALLGVRVDSTRCTDCGACLHVCPVDIRQVGDRECIQCGECVPKCPESAIIWKGMLRDAHRITKLKTASKEEQL